MKFAHCQQFEYVGRGGGGADDKFVTLFVKKGIRPGVCVQPVISHLASGIVGYGWLIADTRPCPFLQRGLMIVSYAVIDCTIISH